MLRALPSRVAARHVIVTIFSVIALVSTASAQTASDDRASDDTAGQTGPWLGFGWSSTFGSGPATYSTIPSIDHGSYQGWRLYAEMIGRDELLGLSARLLLSHADVSLGRGANSSQTGSGTGPASITNELRYDEWELGGEVLMRYAPVTGLSIGLGPAIGFRWADNLPSQIADSRPSLAGVLAADYAIPVDPLFTITPQLRLRHDFLARNADVDITPWTLEGGVGIHYLMTGEPGVPADTSVHIPSDRVWSSRAGLTLTGLYGIGHNKAGLTGPLGPDCYSVDSAAEHHYAIQAGVLLPDLFSHGLGLSARLSYFDRSSAILTHLPGVPVLISDQSGDVTTVTELVDSRVDIRSKNLELELLPRFEPVTDLALAAGLALGTPLSMNRLDAQRIISPPNTKFINDPRYERRDNGRTLVFSDGTPSDVRKLTAAAIVGLSYTIPIVGSFSLMPEARLRYDLVDPDGGTSFKPLSYEGALSVILDLGSDRPEGPDAVDDTLGVIRDAGGSWHAAQTAIGGSYMLGRTTGDIELPGTPSAESVSARLRDAAGSVEIGSTDLINRNVGLFGRLSYNRLKLSAGRASTVYALTPDHRPTVADTRIDYEATIESIDLDLTTRMRLPLGFALGAGIGLGVRTAIDGKTTETIAGSDAVFTSSPNVLAGETDRFRIRTDGPAYIPRTLSAGILLSLSHQIDLFDRLSIVPEISVRREMISPAQQENWRPYTIGAGLMLRCTLPGSPQHFALLDAPGRDLPRTHDRDTSAASPISVGIDLYSLDDYGDTTQRGIIRGECVQWQRTILPPPVFLFPPMSTQIPTSSLTTSSEDTTSRIDPVEAYHHLLDLVGRRLQRYADQYVTLVGCAAPDEPASLATARAAAIRHCLVEGWGCSPAQIIIATEQPARVTDPDLLRSVRISGLDPAQLAVRATWQERSFRSSPIRLEPSIDAARGVRDWTLEFLQGTRTISRTSSADSGARISLDMLVHDLASTSRPAPLTARLTVEDSTGARATAEDALPFELRDPECGEDSARIASYILFPSENDSDVVLRQVDSTIAAIAATSTPPGARVAVRPLGPPEPGNEKVASRQLQSVADRIREAVNGKVDVTITVEEHSPTELAAARGTAEEKLLRSGIEITIADRGMER
jgi:hypothetical protein